MHRVEKTKQCGLMFLMTHDTWSKWQWQHISLSFRLCRRSCWIACHSVQDVEISLHGRSSQTNLKLNDNHFAKERSCYNLCTAEKKHNSEWIPLPSVLTRNGRKKREQWMRCVFLKTWRLDTHSHIIQRHPSSTHTPIELYILNNTKDRKIKQCTYFKRNAFFREL